MNANLHQHTNTSREKSLSVNNLTNLPKATQTTIEEAFEANKPTLVNAPPGSGKTYSVPRVADELDEPVTYLTERRDLYDNMESECRSVGLSSYVLPSAYEECPTINPNDDTYHGEREREIHSNGVSGAKIHEALNLSCTDECDYLDRLDFDPENFDVLIGNYVHGYATKYTEGRTVVLDEFAGKGYVHEVEHVPQKVSAFLRRASSTGYDNYSDLIRRGTEAFTTPELKAWATMSREVYDRTIVEDKQGAISKRSVDLTLALLFMHDLGNGWESTRWHTEEMVEPRPGVNVKADVLYDPPSRFLLPREVEAARCLENDTNTVWLRQKPDFEESNSVVALDGTPVKRMWNAATGITWHESRVVPRGEMGHYLHNVMGTEVVQTGSGSKPYHSGQWVTGDIDGATLLSAEVKFGEKPGVITTKKVLRDVYTNIEDISDGTLNFARVKSNNQFAPKEVGVVLGTPHPGDDYLKRWGALMGHSIQGTSSPGQARQYGPLGDEILEHFRENQVLQSVLRFGRDKNKSATVFVNHEAYPDWITAKRVKPKFLGKKRRQAIRTLRESSDPLTTGEIAAQSGVSKTTVRDTVADMKDEGFVEEIGYDYQYQWT